MRSNAQYSCRLPRPRAISQEHPQAFLGKGKCIHLTIIPIFKSTVSSG
jgi:hypothetical protein